jgi:hypothetical protein
MANYAIVKDGIVKNVVIWNGDKAYDVEGETLVEATADTQIGGTYDGAFHYVEPIPPEPTAEQIARQVKLDSVKSKLEALGLTTEEVQEAFGL